MNGTFRHHLEKIWSVMQELIFQKSITAGIVNLPTMIEERLSNYGHSIELPCRSSF